MNKITTLLTLVFFAYSTPGNSQERGMRPVQDWWRQCSKTSEAACLTDEELSKFKFICADEAYREDCRAVVNYAVAKAKK